MKSIRKICVFAVFFVIALSQACYAEVGEPCSRCADRCRDDKEEARCLKVCLGTCYDKPPDISPDSPIPVNLPKPMLP